MPVDAAARDVARACFVSYDEGAWIRAPKEFVSWRMPKPRPARDWSAVEFEGFYDLPQEGGRNNWLTPQAFIAGMQGSRERYSAALAEALAAGLDENEARKTAEAAYERGGRAS